MRYLALVIFLLASLHAWGGNFTYIKGSHLVNSTATIPAANSTSILTSADATFQRITGVGSQTIRLPSTAALADGVYFTIQNMATQTATITDSTSSIVRLIPSNSEGTVTNYLGTWVTTFPPASVSTLDDLTDVSITSPLSGNYLYYNGSNWMNRALSLDLASYATNSGVTASTTDTAITSKLLTGYSKTGSLPISSTDSIKVAIQKLENNTGAGSVGGTGTLNKLAKFSDTASITNSSLTDDGISVSTTLPIVTTGSLTATSIVNINRDNLMNDGSFESGISEIVCSSGVCTNDATSAIGLKSLKIATTSTTASVTWSKVNAALANRDLGIDLELKSDNTTMQLCGQVLGVKQNCVSMAIVGSYGRLATSVTADASGNFGWVVQSSTATSTTTTNVDNAHVTTNPFTYKNLYDEQVIIANTDNGYGSAGTTVRKFSTLQQDTGSSLFTYSINDATTGAYFTAKSDMWINVTWAEQTHVSGYYHCITINGDPTKTCPNQTVSTILGGIETALADIGSLQSWSGFIKVGDTIRPQIEAGSTPSGIAQQFTIHGRKLSEYVVTPAKTTVENWLISQPQNVATDITGEIKLNLSTATILKQGSASTESALKATSNLVYAVDGANETRLYSSTQSYFIVNTTSTNGTSGNDFKIYKNGSSYWFDHSENTANYRLSGSIVIPMNQGDYVSFYGSAWTSDASAFSVSITAFASNATFLAAVPTVKTCRMTETLAYNVACGSSSADTTVTRNLTSTDSSSDCTFLSLAANAFKPIAGTYCIDAGTNAYLTNRTMAMIYDGSSVVATGRTTHAYAAGTASATPQVKYCFSTDGTKSYSLQQYTTSASSTSGLGVESAKSGISTVCSEMIVIKYK